MGQANLGSAHSVRPYRTPRPSAWLWALSQNPCFGTASAVLLAAGIVAAAVPGIRASRTDPVEALRVE